MKSSRVSWHGVGKQVCFYYALYIVTLVYIVIIINTVTKYIYIYIKV